MTEQDKQLQDLRIINDRLRADNEKLRAENTQLRADLIQLQSTLEEVRRVADRWIKEATDALKV